MFRSENVLKPVVSCSCLQKENTQQKETFHLVDPRTKQRKQTFEFLNLKMCDYIDSEFKFSMKSTMIGVNIYFTFYTNNNSYP